MSAPHHSPDGLTYDDITALQRDVTAELRREGHLPRPRRRRPGSASCRPHDGAHAHTTRAHNSPAAPRGQGRGEYR
jgi:hypothetical protein